jgi:hypothetical protein
MRTTPTVYRLERRASGYHETTTGRRKAVFAKANDAIAHLAHQAVATAAGLPLRDILTRHFNEGPHSAPRRQCVASSTGWYGHVRLYQVNDVSFLSWCHGSVVRGVELLGSIDDASAERKLLRRAGLVAPNLYRDPVNMLGLSNVRPWRPLPADATPWLDVLATLPDGEVIGNVVVHRWAGASGVRWLFTFPSGTDVFGDHPNLDAVLRRLEDRYYWGGLEVHPLHADSVPPR